MEQGIHGDHMTPSMERDIDSVTIMQAENICRKLMSYPPLDLPVNLPPPPLPVLPPIQPPAPEPPRCTQRVSRPPGEWWKVKHAVEPEAEPPVIWSDDEEDPAKDQQANLVSDPEPRTFNQAMHGDKSDCWREAATLEYNTLVENGT